MSLHLANLIILAERAILEVDLEVAVRQVTIHAAKTQLSKLIEAALDGEEVVIARRDKPVVRLVPVHQGRFKIGILEGKLGEGPDFFSPLPSDELDRWEGGP